MRFLARLHNIAGEMAAWIDPAGNQTTYTHDNLGNRLTETLPEVGGQTPVRSSMYDIYGGTVSQTDVQGDTSESVFDDLGRMICSIEPLAGGLDATLDDGAASLVGTWLTQADDDAYGVSVPGSAS